LYFSGERLFHSLSSRRFPSRILPATDTQAAVRTRRIVIHSPCFDAAAGRCQEKFSLLTVPRSVGGFRSSSIYHTEKVLRLSQDLPIVIEAAEFTERIEKNPPRLDEMIGGGLATLEIVRVILYRSHKK